MTNIDVFSKNSDQTTGIYCMANDKVIDWFIAFINSLYTFNPSARLSVIPFDDNITKLSALRKKYGFDLIESPIFEKMDAIGRIIYPSNDVACHTFRKFYIFWGLFDRFFFFDADIVIHQNLDMFFDKNTMMDHDFIYFDESMDMVFKQGSFRDRMIAEYGSRGFNTGSFLSVKDLLTLEQVQSMAEEVKSSADQFAPTAEQPFFNFCLDTTGLRIGHISEAIPSTDGPTWAGARDIGRYLANDSTPFIHWAGYSLNGTMPQKDCFLKYRLKDLDFHKKLGFLLSWQIVTSKRRLRLLIGNRRLRS